MNRNAAADVFRAVATEAGVALPTPRPAAVHPLRDPPPPQPDPLPGDRLVTRRLADVEAEQVEWLWPGRIPFGKLTALAGDPGVGKSYLTMALAAAVTRGAPLPGGPARRPANALMASYEDEAGDTLRPRAELLGADLARLTVLDGAIDDKGVRQPFGPDAVDELDGHLARLESAARPALLIVDPVSAFVGAGVDTYRDNEVRGALEALRVAAAQWRIAVVLVMHLRKSGAATALARLSGSGAYGALVRSALLAGRDPEDDTACALAHVKHNLASRQPTLGYRITDAGFEWTGERPDLDGERLAGHDPDDARTQRDDATEFLTEVLANGPVKSADVKDLAKREGVSERTLQRTTKRLSVVVERKGTGAAHYTMWSLPVVDSGHEPHSRHSRQAHTGGASGASGASGLSGGAAATESEALDVAHVSPAEPCETCGRPCSAIVNGRRAHVPCYRRTA